MTRRGPNLAAERRLLRSGATLVAGVDEVGRGALAGPVSVGVVVVGARTTRCPDGLTDSKLLSALVRERLEPDVAAWCVGWGVGHAQAAEIDAVGIVAALRLAGTRALTRATAGCGPVDAVLLDGSHDWLTMPEQPDLFTTASDGLSGDAEPAGVSVPVHMVVKGDQRCASIAGASVLAKCARDRLMVDLAPRYPAYGWEGNKGYGAPAHLAALRELGPTELHRRSWRLPDRVPVASFEAR